MTKRLKNKKEIATYLGLSYPNFLAKEHRLQAVGFPKLELVVNRYDIKKVDAWLDNDTIQRDSGLKKHYESKLSLLKNNH
jgi:hypothetical protein|tara:strand:+ start:321 stop:560 length:240 start_codon:yes stop_codon:yes gene_type:complete